MVTCSLMDEYYNWLVGTVAGGARRDRYQSLFGMLMDIPFYSLVPHDENRLADGLKLRSEFAALFSYDELFWRGHISCDSSVLEVLIAIAIRWDRELMLSRDGPRYSEWFWEMLENLGLDRMDDLDWDEDEAERLVYIFLDRMYDYDGTGGLFPMKDPPDDMRKTELSYQLDWYVTEKYWDGSEMREIE